MPLSSAQDYPLWVNALIFLAAAILLAVVDGFIGKAALTLSALLAFAAYGLRTGERLMRASAGGHCSFV